MHQPGREAPRQARRKRSAPTPSRGRRSPQAAPLAHIPDESVLLDLVRQGPSHGITRHIVTLAQLAADAGAELIAFTCSSTSPAIDTACQTVSAPILKIDDPLYACMASAQGRVGLICTTSSTVTPSPALLTAHAQSAGRDIAAVGVLCAPASEAMSSGRRDLHDRLVCEAAAELAPRVDRIVLAQASLAHLGGSIQDGFAGRTLLCQTRRMVVAPTPRCSTSVRLLQCVALIGLSCSVACTIRDSIWAVIVAGRPLRGASLRSASMPPARKR